MTPTLDLGSTAIARLLPHRPPALRVDRLLALRAAPPSLLASFSVDAGDPAFDGHFPGAPLLPGVVTIEALAQASGMLLGVMARADAHPDGWAGAVSALGDAARPDAPVGAVPIGMLTGTRVKLLAPVGPGSVVELEVRHQGHVGHQHRVAVEARVRGVPVASGTLTLAVLACGALPAPVP
jgi:3-hydroxymyristoyl/3-hydroxydecanoyl-(acyl carrier protein) dehydratase